MNPPKENIPEPIILSKDAVDEPDSVNEPLGVTVKLEAVISRGLPPVNFVTVRFEAVISEASITPN